MSSEQELDPQHRTREAEREWHEQFYSAHAATAFPPSAEDFRQLFIKQHLTAFCDGGWSWWASAGSSSTGTRSSSRAA